MTCGAAGVRGPLSRPRTVPAHSYPRPGPATQRQDSDAGIQQQVQGDALFGAASVQSERLPVATHQAHLFASVTRPSADPFSLVKISPAWQGRSRAWSRSAMSRVQLINPLGGDVDFLDPAPFAGCGQLGAVILCDQAHRRGLDP